MANTKVQWLSDFYNWEPATHDLQTLDYVAINNDIRLVKFEPEIANANMFKAASFEIFFDSYTLYQCDTPSEYRKYPIRFLYSKQLGKSFELKGSNESIYNMMDQIWANKGNDEKEEWLRRHYYKYLKFFFDNVTGKFGRFEIVDTVEQLENRYKVFKGLVSINILPKNTTGEEYDSLLENDYKSAFKKLIPGNQPQLIDVIETIYELEGKDFYRAKNIFIFFRNSLFKADALFEVENFGHLVLKDEDIMFSLPD